MMEAGVIGEDENFELIEGEFWVIDADERITWVHTGPSGDTWSSVVERGPQDALTTPAVPGFSIRLADIG